MHPEKNSPPSLESELSSLGKALRRSPPAPRTIHLTITKALRDTLQNFPANTRIPPIRYLCKQLNISLVTAQRIISDLTQEGILYSQPRSGVFIASPASTTSHTPSATSPKDRIPAGVFESSFSFGTGSVEDFQQPLWKDLIHKFCQKYPNTSPKLQHILDPSEKVDAYERLEWNNDWVGDSNHRLDLRESAPASLADRSTPEGLIPLYHRSNFLFYHPELLHRCEISPPNYRTFGEQLQFFKNASPKLKAKGYDPLPFSMQQPITLLGSRHLDLFFRLVYKSKPEPATRREFIEATGRVLELCQTCQRAPGSNNPLADENRLRFMKGKEIPLFLSHSVDFWRFTEANLPTPIEAYPILSTDDSLFLWPMVGTATRNSRNPVEALRFLSFLVSDEAQGAFSQTGTYGADLNPRFSPTTTADPDWLKETLTRSSPIRLASSELFYLAIRILNNELWHALLDHVSVEQAVEEALQLGRVFTLQSRQSAQQSSTNSQ
ncbi:MAG: GntR family transcriptional regulator [Puniceicoccales bacterium]